MNKAIVISLSLATLTAPLSGIGTNIKSENVLNIRSVSEDTNTNIDNIEEEIRLSEEAKAKILEREAIIAEAKIKERNEEIARISSVSFNPQDLRIVSNLKTDELRKVFKSMDCADKMVKLAPAFIDAEKVYGVNAFGLAGIIALESSWNTSSRAIRQNNLSGYAVYSDNSKGRDFSSAYECILETAKLLKEDYLNEDGKCHNGFSIKSVNELYSSDKNWSTSVTKIGENLLDRYLEIIKVECEDKSL